MEVRVDDYNVTYTSGKYTSRRDKLPACFIGYIPYIREGTTDTFRIRVLDKHHRFPRYYIDYHLNSVSEEGYVLPLTKGKNHWWTFTVDGFYHRWYQTVCVIRDIRRNPHTVLKAVKAHKKLKHLGITYTQCYAYFYPFDYRVGHAHMKAPDNIFNTNLSLVGFVGSVYLFGHHRPYSKPYNSQVGDKGAALLYPKTSLDKKYDKWGRDTKEVSETVNKEEVLYPGWANLLENPSTYYNDPTLVRSLKEASREYDYKEIRRIVQNLR